ncbi:unnamed protein product [Ilex paraguariensis]|uniref:Uncharacterized protein n=1 Tax=Ilex paraguariensis TaxID=185542 RepID=A0ABC8QYT0_9AQUA
MATSTDGGGLEALHRLKSTDPPVYLSQSPDLSEAARLASQYIFSSLTPHTPKSPFTHLLIEGFDAEQIWQQIDLQSQPLISTLRREIKKFEKNPEEISKLFQTVGVRNENLEGKSKGVGLEGEKRNLERESEDFEGVEDKVLEVSDEEEEEEEGEGEGEGEEEEEEEEEEGGGGGVEDEFLKIKELEEYLQDDEAREYGLESRKKGERKVYNDEEDEDGNDEEEEHDEGEDTDEFEALGLEDDEDDERGDKLRNARCCFLFLLLYENIYSAFPSLAHVVL